MTSLFKRALRMMAASGGSLLVTAALAQAPSMPAAPLAGGAAAMGGSYVDVHGNPIVMPANFLQPAAGYDGYGGAGGYGDPGAAYVDFGGYGPDQCGPYYFDIAVEGVALMSEDLFQDVLPFGSIGPEDPLAPTPTAKVLDPQKQLQDYEVGWQIAARLDLGPLSVLEATYMGIYDYSFSDTVRSVDVSPANADNFLFSVFSNYGNPTIISGLDQGSVYSLNYDGDLQSTELSYRRYWLGDSPRISGTYLLGARYIRMTEDLRFDTITDFLAPDTFLAGNLQWGADNDLVGFQMGGDMWICLLQGLRLGGEAKAGIYNNRFEFRHSTDIPDGTITNVNFVTKGDQVAFAGESRIDLVADILPSFSIRGGYRILYMNSLVTVGNNVRPDELDDLVADTAILTQADALYHGFHAGLEYIW